MGGEGRPESGYPRIAGQPRAYLERQLEAYADGRRHSMVMAPLAKRLTKEERVSVAAHFSSQSGLSSKNPNQAPGPERGRTLARVGDNDLRVQACQNCHGPEGTGQPPSGPYLAGLDRAYLRRELMAWRDGSRTTDPSGAMGIIARHLTEADIDAVAAHYAGLPPPRAADF